MLDLVLFTSFWILSNAYYTSCPGNNTDPCTGTSATVCCLDSSTNTVTQTNECYAKCNNNDLLPDTCGICCYVGTPNAVCTNGGTCTGSSGNYGYCDTTACVTGGGCRDANDCANSQSGQDCIIDTTGSDPYCGYCGTSDPCAGIANTCDTSTGCNNAGEECLQYTTSSSPSITCNTCQQCECTANTACSDTTKICEGYDDTITDPTDPAKCGMCIDPCSGIPTCSPSTECGTDYECLPYDTDATCNMCQYCPCSATKGCSNSLETCDYYTDPAGTGTGDCGYCLDSCVYNGQCRDDSHCANSLYGDKCIKDSNAECGYCGTICDTYTWNCDPDIDYCTTTGYECLSFTYNGVDCYKCQPDSCLSDGGCYSNDNCVNSASGSECQWSQSSTNCGVCGDPCAGIPNTCDTSSGCNNAGEECLQYTTSSSPYVTCNTCQQCECTANTACSDTTKVCYGYDDTITDPTDPAKCGICMDPCSGITTCSSSTECNPNGGTDYECLTYDADATCNTCQYCPCSAAKGCSNSLETCDYYTDPAGTMTGDCGYCLDSCVYNGQCRDDSHCANSLYGDKCIKDSNAECGYCGTICDTYAWNCDPDIDYCTTTGYECLSFTYNGVDCNKCQPDSCLSGGGCYSNDNCVNSASGSECQWASQSTYCGVCADPTDDCIAYGGCRTDTDCANSQYGTDCIDDSSNPDCGYCGTTPTTTAATADCTNPCTTTVGCSVSGYQCLPFTENGVTCYKCQECECTANNGCSDTSKTCDISNAYPSNPGTVQCGVCVDITTTTEAATTAGTTDPCPNACETDEECRTTTGGNANYYRQCVDDPTGAGGCKICVDSTPTTTDSGTTDSGTTDSGTTDSGTTDAGTTDAGTTDPCPNACKTNQDCRTTSGGNANYYRQCVDDPTGAGGCNVCVDSTPTTTDSGTTDAGTTDSGTTGSGATDSGANDAGTTDSGTNDSGTTDSGATDSGTTDSGTTDSGTTDSAITACPNAGCRADAECDQSSNPGQQCDKTTVSGVVSDCGTCIDITPNDLDNNPNDNSVNNANLYTITIGIGFVKIILSVM